jgi:signal peptidase I
VLGVLLLAYLLLFDLSIMASDSMAPTLRGRAVGDGDWVLTTRFSYWFRTPRRWEILTLDSPDGMRIMKRVVGRPGETVALRDGQAVIDGEVVEFPPHLTDLHYYNYGKLVAGRSLAAGEGWVVLGDFSRDSYDSRWEGPVREAQIIGRAYMIVWPPSRIRVLGP